MIIVSASQMRSINAGNTAASWHRHPLFWIVTAVTVGSLFVVNVGGALSLRLLDLIWFAAIATIFIKLMLGHSTPVLQLPAQQMLCYWTYFGLAISFPLFGLVVNDLPASALAISIRYLVMGTLIYAMTAAWSPKVWSEDIFMRALQIGVLLNLAYVVLQYAEFAGLIPFGALPHHYLSGFLEESTFDSIWRPSGLFKMMNVLGWFGCICSLLFLSLALTRGRSSDWIFGGLSLALPLLANSRTAFICALAAMIVMGFFTLLTGRKKVVLRWFGVSSIMAILIVPAVVYVAAFQRVQLAFAVLTGGLGADRSLALRVGERWPKGIEVFLDYPWGYGGAVGDAAGTAVDSAWIAYLAQGTLLLPLAFLAFLATSGLFGMRSYLRVDNPFGLAVFGMSVAIAAGSIMLPPFNGYPVIATLFLITFSIATRADKQRQLTRCAE
jgi:hypothetical protein